MTSKTWRLVRLLSLNCYVDLTQKIMSPQVDEEIVEEFQSFIEGCHRHAMEHISQGFFTTAHQILSMCLRLLKSSLGQQFPDLTYLTFNYIAHSLNLQGNVTMSLKTLLKGLKQALKISDLEQRCAKNFQTRNLPIVETYINICNGYLFEDKIDLAMKYCQEGLAMSLKITELLDIRIKSYQISDQEKEATLKHLFHILKLYLQGLKSKGQILEQKK